MTDIGEVDLLIKVLSKYPGWRNLQNLKLWDFFFFLITTDLQKHVVEATDSLDKRLEAKMLTLKTGIRLPRVLLDSFEEKSLRKKKLER